MIFEANSKRPAISLAALVLASVCSLAVAQGKQPGTAPGAEAKVRAMEDARFQAQQRKDNHTLDAMFDNALVWVEQDGSLLTKAEYLAQVHEAGSGILEIAAQSMKVHTFSDSAIVSGIYRERGIRNGQAYLRRYHFVDTWQLKSGKWICIAASASPAR